MSKIYMILFFFLINTTAFSQKIVTGRIIDDRNNPIFGAIIYPDNQDYGTISDLNGEFSVQVSDSATYILILIDKIFPKELNYGIDLDLNERIFERFSISYKDSILVKLIPEQNTFAKISETTKIKSIQEEKYNYELKYNILGKLHHIYKIDSELNCIENIFEIQYYRNCVITQEFRWNEKKKKQDLQYKYFFYFDSRGAIRSEAIVNEFWLNPENDHSYIKYNYDDDKIRSMYFNEIQKNNLPKNPEPFTYKEDIITKIIQSEILRRKLYKRIEPAYFSSDFKLIEIEK